MKCFINKVRFESFLQTLQVRKTKTDRVMKEPCLTKLNNVLQLKLKKRNIFFCYMYNFLFFYFVYFVKHFFSFEFECSGSIIFACAFCGFRLHLLLLDSTACGQNPHLPQQAPPPTWVSTSTSMTSRSLPITPSSPAWTYTYATTAPPWMKVFHLIHMDHSLCCRGTLKSLCWLIQT